MTGGQLLFGFLRLKSYFIAPFLMLALLAGGNNLLAQEEDIEEEIELAGDLDDEIDDKELDEDMEQEAAEAAPPKQREIKKWIRWADEAFYNKNYRKAVIYYESLAEHVKEDNAYFQFRAGICYLLSSLDSKRAIELIENGKDDLADTELRSEYFYYLGRAYHFDEQYGKAKLQYELAGQADSTNRELEIEVERQIEMCQYGEKFVKEPGNVMISNAGLPLNSEFPDYKPVPNFDETQVIFTSRRELSVGEERDETGRYYEDVFVSHRDVFGNWSVPTTLSDEINSSKHESSSFLSEDGHKLIIYKSTKKEGAGLYLTEFDGEKWTKPQSFGENVNSKFWETSAALSPDGKTLYFVSNRRGGMGGRDMYYSKLREDNTWGPAINLVDINTEFDEESPFMAADGKTLYFSSQGHSSIGGFDIFKTTLENGEWTEPENLGHPVNTPADEAHFTITKDQSRAYVTSSRVGGKGETDVYTLTFLDHYKMDVPLRTFVRNENGEPVKADVAVVDGATLRKVKTLDLDGGADYISYVKPGKSYELIVEAEGFTPEMISFEVPAQDNYHEVYQYIEMDQKEMFGKKVGQTLTVSHLFTDVKASLKGDKSIREHTHPINREYLLLSSNKILNNWGDLSQVQKAVESSDKITGLVAAHYETVLDDKLYSDLNSYTHFYTGDQKALLAKVVGDDTVYVIPPTKPVTEEEIAGLDEKLAQIENQLSADTANQNSKVPELAAIVEKAVGEADVVAVNTGGSETGTGTGSESSQSSGSNENSSGSTTGQTGASNTTGGGEVASTTPKVIYDEAVYFGFDQSGISEDYKQELNKIAKLAKENPNSTIEVQGHTDSRGSESYNISLSKRRAKIVADYLASVGIPRSRMVIKGYGESRPIAPNANPDGSDNPAGRKKNRRTEIRLKG